MNVYKLIIVGLAIAILPRVVGAVNLDECIVLALADNPSALAAYDRVDAARAMIRQATSAYYPRLFVALNWARTDNPPQAFMMALNQRTLDMRSPDFDPNNPGSTSDTRFTAGVKYRLFDSGAREMYRQMTLYGKDAATEQWTAARNELIFEVIHGFYGTLQAQSFVEVMQESVSSLEESLRVATERYNAGSVMKTDVLNLEVALAQARQDLIGVANGTQMAIAALNTALGQDKIGSDGLQVPEQLPEELPPPEQNLELVENRPELRAVLNVAQMKKKAYRKAICDYFPTLSAVGSSDWDSANFSDFQNSYFVGVVAEWEFFEGLQKYGSISQAKAEWKAAVRDAEQARNQLRLDLRQAYLRATESWERFDLARKSLESATEALRIAREQYRQGAADVTTILTAQVGLTATRTRNVAAYYDYVIALANIERAQGALTKKWEPNSGQEDKNTKVMEKQTLTQR